jgi:hypothetical protein
VITSSPFRKNLAQSQNRRVPTKLQALFPVKNKKRNPTSQVSTAVQAKRRKPTQDPEEKKTGTRMMPSASFALESFPKTTREISGSSASSVSTGVSKTVRGLKL